MHQSVERSEPRQLTLGESLLLTVVLVQVIVFLMIIDEGITAQNIDHAAPVGYYVKIESIVVAVGVGCTIIYGLSRRAKRGK